MLLFYFDTQKGADIVYQYPETYSLEDGVVNKIFLGHSFSEQDTEKKELIELRLDKEIFWSYCDHGRIQEHGYEILVLGLKEQDLPFAQRLRPRFVNFAHLVFKHELDERLAYMNANIDLFFEQSLEQKVLLLGRAGTGKSSIKQVIFEGKNPYKLLFSPLEPTLDLEPSSYAWLDLNLGIFDSSGQEIDSLLSTGSMQDFAFEQVALIIYMADVMAWLSDPSQILDDIEKISRIIGEREVLSKLVVFLNKVDLVNRDQRDTTISEIEGQIKDVADVIVFFTSIHPDLIYLTYNAFSELLGMLSPSAKGLKQVLDDQLGATSNAGFFITNSNGAIVAQTFSKDFNHELANPLLGLVIQVDLGLETLQSDDHIERMLFRSAKGISVTIEHLGIPEFDAWNLVAISPNPLDPEVLDVISTFKDVLFARFYEKGA